MKLKIACMDRPSQELLEVSEALEAIKIDWASLLPDLEAAIDSPSESTYEDVAVQLAAIADTDIEIGAINIYDSLDGETYTVVICDLDADEAEELADDHEDEVADEPEEWD